MRYYCGISDRFHDAGMSFIDTNGNIVFASQSERFSKVKNDPKLHPTLFKMLNKEDNVSFYENVRHKIIWMEKWKSLSKSMKKDLLTSKYKINKFFNHHESHCAFAFYTRPWDSKDDTVLLSIDGHGEYQSSVIMDSNFNLLHETILPESIGTAYAIATEALGYRPMEEEYTVMGLASYGEPRFVDQIIHAIEHSKSQLDSALKIDGALNHYRDIMKKEFARLSYENKQDFACSIQKWAEIEILKLAKLARKYGSKVCYSGGVAQNVVANSKIKELFDDMHIAVHPADGGSSLGAAARHYGLLHDKDKINWIDPYLGYEMGEINATEVVNYLLEYNYCGIASGRAEFGPRALGNRSLIADPRRDVKDTVNKVKRRQKFRPFAPAILEEYANEYFDGPMNEYMQFSNNAKHDYKSVTHVDGTARVQIVKSNCNSVLRKILEEFYEKTGVPMLLNTSLNIKSKPIVNNKYDCYLFEKVNKTKVFYNDTF